MKYFRIDRIEKESTLPSFIVVDGKPMKTAVCAKLLGLHTTTIHGAFNRKNLKEFERWFNDSYVRLKFNLHGRTTIFWKNNTPCWSKLVELHTGISSQSAGVRLNLWQNGDIDCDQLFRWKEAKDKNKNNNIIYKPKTKGLQIKKVKEKNKIYIVIEGKKYNVFAAAKFLNIPFNTFNTRLYEVNTSVDKTQLYLDTLAWKYDNDINMREVVYIRFDSKMCSSTIIQRVVGISNEGARNRLKRWKNGHITTEELFAERYDKNYTYNDSMKHIPKGDLAHLSNKKKPCPEFHGTKYDKILSREGVVQHNYQPLTRKN